MLKFGIGTSQYIKNYGILRKNIKKKEFIELIKKKSKYINLIDTAPSYNNAENIIGKYSNRNFRIVSKFNKINTRNNKSKFNELKKGFTKSLSDLERKKIYGILFHDVVDIDILKNDDLKKKFYKLIKNSTLKVGFSSYNIDELEKYLKIFKFDIIQIPINPFNINKKKILLLKNLKKKYKIEIHARSIFLQGLGLEKVSRLPKKFDILKQKIIEIDQLTKKYKVSRYNFFISLIKSLKIIDYAIIGMRNKKDFYSLENLKLIKIQNKDIYNFEIKNKKLIDPRSWKL